MAEIEADISVISGLIVKKIKGTITSDENAVLEKWMALSNKHKALYDRLVNEEYVRKQYRLVEKIDEDKVWTMLTRKTRKHRRLYFAYAASVLLLIGGIAFWWVHENMKKQNSSVVTVAQSILPGTGKATLIVEGQETVHLNKDHFIRGVDDSGVRYNNDTSMLYYHADTNSGGVGQIYESHTLEVGKGGEYSVKLSDGTKVYMNSESRLKYPIVFDTAERKVYLEGEAYFEVEADETKPFIVEGKDFSVKVLGTCFNISNYQDEDAARVVLLEGRVQVNKADKIYKLMPNQAIEMRGDSVELKQVNAVNAISWKNDKFYFSNERLEVVMGRLARWYDVELFYENIVVKNYHFTGFIPKYGEITKAIEILELTTDVQFVLKGRTVIIKKQ